MNHTGTQEIETKRLILRRFTVEDVADAYNNWFCDPEVAMYMRWNAHTSISQTEESLKRYIAGYAEPDFYRWAIMLKNGSSVIGAIGFHVSSEYDSVADVAYSLGKKFWNQGFASEALKAVLNYALIGVGINRIEAFHSVDNPASGRVMQKAGMRFEGRARQKYRSHKAFEDSDMYAVLREDLINPAT